MAQELHCSLRKCIQGSLTRKMAHVEVKSFPIAGDHRQHMEVSWLDSGEAVFHDLCWKALIDSLKMENPFSLGSQEKSLLLEAKKTAEYFDSEEKVKAEALRVAQMLKSAQYAVVFTGAGISTSAGIGDFRGRSGKWTERDREKRCPGAAKHRDRSGFIFESLRPTYTHEAICKLLEVGIVKHIISQNTDGLHRLSGIPRDKISELHGNSFCEKCEKCSARYERNFAVRRDGTEPVPPKLCVHCNFDHRTGRLCERQNCGGYLTNTIINFGDSLEKNVLSGAEQQAQYNDLMLCLGSSLRVAPACDLVEMGRHPARIVICNRQPTPFDKLCYDATSDVGSRVFGDCDSFMRYIMAAVLSSEVLHEWEQGRDERLREYSRHRHC